MGLLYVLLYLTVLVIDSKDDILDFLNSDPASDLVKKSAIVSLVGQYSMDTSPHLTLSVI